MIDISVTKQLKSATGNMLLNIDLSIEKGTFLNVYGKSGAGKTSLLRMISGLLAPDEGTLTVDGTAWFDSKSKLDLAPQKRKVGMVFQDYALFPNMTVKENLLFGLKKGQDVSIVDQLLEITDLGELQNQKPPFLSGGQQQRTALARALVQQPEILLMDEPLSALDTEMRIQLQQYILQVHREFSLTTILVSHDISEIIKMADRMVVLENGRIEKDGKPTEVFGHQEVSGKFQFTGELIGMEQQGFIYILSILIGNNLVKVVADESEAKELEIGDKLLVASKAFNPVVKKLN
jgi:molybdate transport system ATP-binding protein